ncbi:hypothetical protein [Flavimarina sp. Hel_I_48]|uniref:hypothetical protein n=1 Tax=Flavimarina sp. Hel_I_48 TaxID=1392488 RepID=UPI000691E838|nr:hypothetical protein [Flavimarina sp. Hel_I_48]
MKLYIVTIAVTCLTGLNSFKCLSQEKTTKITERYDATEEINLFVEAQNTDVVFENWNKDQVQIEAILETEDLSEEQIEELKNAWAVNIQGNSGSIRINSSGNTSAGLPFVAGSNGGINTMVSSSMEMLEPMMQQMLAPMLERLQGEQFSKEYYDKIDNVRFDYDAYRQKGEQYLKAYKEKIRTSFGDDYNQVITKWEQQNAQKLNQAKSDAAEKISALPKSPFGKSLNFDPNAYQRDKKQYLNALNKQLGTKVSVAEMDAWMDDLKRWNEDFKESFGKNMTNWGTSMQSNMQSLSANMGTAMEALSQQIEQMAQNTENGNFSKTVTRDANGNVIGTSVRFSSGSVNPAPKSGKIKRTIVVHMPKKAKLDLDIRHGNITLTEAKNARINLSHGGFIAKTIDGDKTYLTIAYSPIDVKSWNYGTLQTNYVKSCVINSAENIKLDARASNITINELGETAVIRGSFGALTIPSLNKNFKSINISLNNSELTLTLPDAAYNFSYNGTRSSLHYPKTLEAKIMRGYDSQMLNGYNKAKNAGGSVMISSKFSDVIVE